MRNEDTMRLLAAVGGVFALIEAILGFEQRRIGDINIISIFLSLILALFVLISVLSPDKPIPLNWIVFVVLGIAMMVYSSLVGGILVLIAGFVGYTEGRY